MNRLAGQLAGSPDSLLLSLERQFDALPVYVPRGDAHLQAGYRQVRAGEPASRRGVGGHEASRGQLAGSPDSLAPLLERELDAPAVEQARRDAHLRRLALIHRRDRGAENARRDDCNGEHARHQPPQPPRVAAEGRAVARSGHRCCDRRGHRADPDRASAMNRSPLHIPGGPVAWLRTSSSSLQQSSLGQYNRPSRCNRPCCIRRQNAGAASEHGDRRDIPRGSEPHGTRCAPSTPSAAVRPGACSTQPYTRGRLLDRPSAQRNRYVRGPPHVRR